MIKSGFLFFCAALALVISCQKAAENRTSAQVIPLPAHRQTEPPAQWWCSEDWKRGDLIFTGRVVEIAPYRKTTLLKTDGTPVQNADADLLGAGLERRQTVRVVAEKIYRGKKEQTEIALDLIGGATQPNVSLNVSESYLIYAEQATYPESKSWIPYGNPKIYPDGLTRPLAGAKTVVDFLETVYQRDVTAEILQIGEKDSSRVSGGIVSGKATNLVKPPYPNAAKKQKLGGAVEVMVLVDEAGKVAKAVAVCPKHPALAEVAVQAALHSSFSPTNISGKPVKVTGIIVYNFTP